MSTDPAENLRKRERGAIIYQAYSRRSGGLSVGINLFPDQKRCSFDCPYCEVFPVKTAYNFSIPVMETALTDALAEARKKGIKAEDICFSGYGEPTQSPFFPAALETAFYIRESEEVKADLVLITNGAGLQNKDIFDLLLRSALKGLKIWLKLDAGTESWYRAMNRSAVPFEQLTAKIRDFVKHAPVVLQTMICSIDGAGPPPEEKQAWEALVTSLALEATALKGVQIYGKARPAPEDPLAEALPETCLEERAASLRAAFALVGKEIPVQVYP